MSTSRQEVQFLLDTNLNTNWSKIMKTIKHYSTIGLNVTINGRPKMARVFFDVKEDNSVKVYVVSANNLNQIKTLGTKTITREELSNLPDDPANEVVFAEAAFGLFGLDIN